MNAARLLEHFERISDAADAVPRLRQLVLDLAIRGRLLNRGAEDSIGSDFDNQQASPPPSEGDKENIDQKAVTRLSLQDEPFRLPVSWRWTTLGELLVKLTDGTHHSPPNHESGEFKYITAKNIKPDGISLENITYVDRATHQSIYGRCDPRKGDVLYVKDGATTGVVTINNLDEEFSMLSSVALLRPAEGVLNSCLVLFMRSPFFYDQMRGQMKGAAITRLTLKRMKPALIPLPPLAEQQRIVAKVDELMALCDRLQAAQVEREARRDRLVAASLARVSQPAADDAGSDARAAGFHLDHFARLTTRPEHVKHLRQSILNLAVRGRLVPQDPKDPPLSPLLDRMAAAKAAHLTRSGSVKNVSTPTPLSSSKAPWLIPASWGWFSFGDVVISRDAERIPVSKEQRSGLAKTYDYYGASGVIDKIDRYLFDKPLLLIGEDGANLINRSTPIAFIARGEYWVNNHAHVLDGESEDLLRFLELHINAIDLKPFVTGTAQPKMNQAKMNSIPIALPPLAEQRRIVAKVDELMTLCDQLEASLAAAATDRARLLESLLHEALAPAA